jgi:hypothetical protein
MPTGILGDRWASRPKWSKMGMGNEDAQQRGVGAIQSGNHGHILARILLCIQWQTEINKQSLAIALDLNATSAYLSAAAMDTYAHGIPLLTLPIRAA